MRDEMVAGGEGMGGEKKLVGWLGSGKREEREKKNKL